MSFIYTLRYMLDPKANTPAKNEKLIKFVKESKIDDVAFFINGEELNHSHLTKAETQVWLDAINLYKKNFLKLV